MAEWLGEQAGCHDCGHMQAADEAAEDDGDLFGDAKRRISDGSGTLPAAADAHQDTNALLDQFFGKDEDLAEDDLFLKRFISKKVSCQKPHAGIGFDVVRQAVVTEFSRVCCYG